jgi:hypothetical protein
MAGCLGFTGIGWAEGFLHLDNAKRPGGLTSWPYA